MAVVPTKQAANLLSCLMARTVTEGVTELKCILEESVIILFQKSELKIEIKEWRLRQAQRSEESQVIVSLF